MRLSRFLLIVLVSMFILSCGSNTDDSSKITNNYFDNLSIDSGSELRLDHYIQELEEYYESTYSYSYDSFDLDYWPNSEGSYVEMNHGGVIERHDLLNYHLSHDNILTFSSRIDPTYLKLREMYETIRYDCKDVFEGEICLEEYLFHFEGDNVYISIEEDDELTEFVFTMKDGKINFIYVYTSIKDGKLYYFVKMEYQEDEYFEQIDFIPEEFANYDDGFIRYRYHDIINQEYVNFIPDEFGGSTKIYLFESNELIDQYSYTDVISYQLNVRNTSLVSFNDSLSSFKLNLSEFLGWDQLVLYPGQTVDLGIDLEYSLFDGDEILLTNGVFVSETDKVYYRLLCGYLDLYNIDEDLITLESIGIDSPYDQEFIAEKLAFSNAELLRIREKYDFYESFLEYRTHIMEKFSIEYDWDN